MTRRTWLTGLALVGVFVVMCVISTLLWGLTSKAPSSNTLAEGSAGAAPSTSATLLATAPGAAGTPEQIADTRCFGDLLAIDAAGLDGIKLAFARGFASDELAAEYVKGRVAELIGDDVNKALDVLAWAKRAPVEDAEVLLAGLAASKGAKDPRVAAALIELGRAGDDVDERVRLAAFDALQTQPELDDDGRAALKDVAIKGPTDEIAWRATRALSSVMSEASRVDGAKPDAFQPYWDELADIASTSGDASVRALALEAPMHSDPILPASTIPKLVDMMLNEPHRDVRELVAFQLGLTEAPGDALDAYRTLFEQEYDECVRWAIFRFAVRAAGQDALPLLEYFASIDPAFVDDLADFKTLFAAGYQDFEQIWLNKEERHACVVEEGEIHGT